MFMEIVSFEVPEGFDDEKIMEHARSVVSYWQAYPDLIRKHFAKSEDGKLIGVYIWPDENAARKAHDQSWIDSFRQRTGVTPHISSCKLFMVIDNENGHVEEYDL